MDVPFKVVLEFESEFGFGISADGTEVMMRFRKELMSPLLCVSTRRREESPSDQA